MAGAAAWLSTSLAEAARAGERAYRGAGGVAEEAIGGVRTVAALGGERRERARCAGIRACFEPATLTICFSRMINALSGVGGARESWHR